MGHVHVILDGDGALEDWRKKGGRPDHYKQDGPEQLRAVYLSNGMESGKPACMVAAYDPIRRDFPVIEMSVEMFLTIAAAFKGKYESEGFTWV